MSGEGRAGSSQQALHPYGLTPTMRTPSAFGSAARTVPHSSSTSSPFAATTKGRHIGVLPTADMLDFSAREESNDDRTTISNPDVTEQQALLARPVHPEIPPSAAQAQHDTRQRDSTMSQTYSTVFARFSSIDYTATTPRTRPCSLTKEEYRIANKESGYGSMSSAGIAIPVPHFCADVRDAVSSTAVPAGRLHSPTLPWLAVFDASFSTFLVILGVAMASQDLRLTAVSGLFAGVASTALYCYIALTLHGDQNAVSEVQLEPHVAQLLLGQGWSADAVESYEQDLRLHELSRLRLDISAKDYAVGAAAQLAGAALTCAPVVGFRLAGTEPLALAVGLAAGVAFVQCVGIRAYQVSAAGTPHHIRLRTALVSMFVVLATSGVVAATARLVRLLFY